MQCKVCNNELNENAVFCPKCGSPVEKNMSTFCPKCGTKIIMGDLFCGSCGYKIGESENVICKNCGSIIKNGAGFCTKCGHKIREDNTSEKELYQKKMIGYYTGIAGLNQISGTLVITNKKVTFTPSAIYVLNKKVVINMDEIAKAERASVMGINLCIRIYTTYGKKHLFALGIQNSKDIQNVVDLINNNRGK